MSVCGEILVKMSLDEYTRKRNFGKTPEPDAVLEESGSDRIYVIQKHYASHLHYDLRLEIDGVLWSWAVPKGPPLDEETKRLAVRTEDHPIEYANFEGTIPKGNYGAGTVEIWDKGTFDLEELSDKKIVVKLQGKRLKGRYVLIKMKPRAGYRGDKNWLFFKLKEKKVSFA